MGAKKAIRIMGHFERAPRNSRKAESPKFCRHCGIPVRETVGNSGYCKKCIALAKVRDEG